MEPTLPSLRLSRRGLLTALAGAALTASARGQDTESDPPQGFVEIHRIRLVNRKDGPIQVSADSGGSWQTIGRVVAPAISASEGYIAAEYADPGTVAAVAVHGIRIRVGGEDKTLHCPLVLSIVPLEFSGATNHGFGGHIAGSAGLMTDIPAGVSLFRDLAPITGNQVFTESQTGRLIPLSPDFKPRGHGEALVIPVWFPTDRLTEVVIENRFGGTVTVTYAGGAQKILSRVVKPVLGTGRFDGTSFTGVGRINTAHTGVVTISTAPVDHAQPEGKGKERRGGFQISPAWHNDRCEEKNAPMMLVLGEIGPDGKALPRRRLLEGTAPLFRYAISVASREPQVDCQIDGGGWEPLPTVVGARMDAFTADGLQQLWREQRHPRTCQHGVTAFRIRLPERSPANSEVVAHRAWETYQKRRLAAAKIAKTPVVHGQFTFKVSPTNPAAVAYVRLSVEGNIKAFTNVAPFELQWDTTRVPNGEYLLDVELLDTTGSLLQNKPFLVYVDNPPALRAEAGTP